MVRWTLALQEHDIEWVHRTAAKHRNADGLTRANGIPADYSYTKGDFVDALTLSECSDAAGCGSPCSTSKAAGWIDAAQTLSSALEVSDTDAVSSLPTLDELRDLQSKDKELQKISRRVDDEAPSVLQARIEGAETGFYRLNGVLMVNSAHGLKAGSWHSLEDLSKREQLLRKRPPQLIRQVCVPSSVRRAVLYSVHGLPISGHDGFHKTLSRARQHFWWRHMERDVRHWVKSCLYCQRRKQSRPTRQGLTQSLLAERPWQTLAYDIVGPLPETASGHTYLLTVVDHFSRFPFAIPMTNKTHASVARAIHRGVFCLVGPPDRLLSDREKTFTSGVQHELWRLLGSKCIHTSGYASRGNGVCERAHRWLNANLALFVNSKKNNWTDYVDSILYAYRTSICSSTGYTPFELVFGRKATMPPDLLYEIHHKQLSDERKRGFSVSESMRDAYRFVRLRQQRVALSNAERRDASRKQVTFREGDVVIQYDPSADTEGPQKYQYRFGQPKVVIRRNSDNPNVYYLKCPKTGRVTVTNVDRLLKAYKDNLDLGEPLGWSKPAQTGLEHDDSLDGAEQQNRKPGVVFEGDMVALRVASEDVEQLPFSVGKVLQINQGGNIVVQWFGTTNPNMLSTWKPGYVQKSVNKRYYHSSRLHHSHPPYTSKDTGTPLVISEHVIGAPFSLNEDLRLPVSVLRAASSDKLVDFTIPTRFEANAFLHLCKILSVE